MSALTLSTVRVSGEDEAFVTVVAMSPLPSPYNILPKLNLPALSSPSISALSRLTKAPALFCEARTALSEISILPNRFLRVSVNWA